MLVTIAATFGIAAALNNSGAIAAITNVLFTATQGAGPLAALAVIYVFGSLLASLVTNNGAAILLFPVCLETARLYDVSPYPFIMTLALAASASFMTPFGYQTNLLVYGPGLAYSAAFFGCVYAGVVAVPAYPPDPARMARTVARLEGVVRDAQVSIVLTSAELSGQTRELLQDVSPATGLRWLVTDTIEDAAAESWRAPALQRSNERGMGNHW